MSCTGARNERVAEERPEPLERSPELRLFEAGARRYGLVKTAFTAGEGHTACGPDDVNSARHAFFALGDEALGRPETYESTDHWQFGVRRSDGEPLCELSIPCCDCPLPSTSSARVRGRARAAPR